MGLIETDIGITSSISVGITWVDGRCVIRQDAKQSQAYYGICHFAANLPSKKIGCIWAISPIDYEYPTMVTTIKVSPTEQYCSKAFSCVNFKCPMNKFEKSIFIEEFKDCGAFSLGIPQNMSEETLWFNDGVWAKFWVKLMMAPEGGTLKFKEN